MIFQRISKPRAIHLPILIGLLVISLLARLVTFERFLPYTDYPDELNMYVLALDWRQSPLAETYGAYRVSEMLGTYPPLFVVTEMGIQTALDWLNHNRWISAGEVIFYTRLVSVIAGVATTLFILDSTRLLAGWLAGLIAGLTWAISVPIVEFNSLAIPDPLAYLGCAIALWGAARAYHHRSFAWAWVGFWGAIIAIYAKYVPFYAVIPPLMLLIWLTVKGQSHWLKWWLVTLVTGVGAAGLLITLVTIRPLNNNEANAVRGRGFERLMDWGRLWNNLQTTLLPIGLISILLVATAILFWIIWKRGKISFRANIYLVSLLLYLLPVVPVSALVNNTGGLAGPEIRHVMPGVIAVVMLWGGACAWLIRQSRPTKALAILGFVVWLIPSLLGLYTLVVRFQPEHIIYQLWKWSDINLPNDGLILMPPSSSVAVTWNRPWSGYDGQTAFQWWLEDPQVSSTPQDYANRGITYFVLTEKDQQHLDSPLFEEFLSGLTPVKTLTSLTPSAGSTVYVYRFLPPQTNVDSLFGDEIRLRGYDLSNLPEAVHLRLYWNSLKIPSANYSVFIHLTKEGDFQPIAQYDGAPSSERRPTLTWGDSRELLISPEIVLPLPKDLASGSYTLRLGLYNYISGERLKQNDGSDAFIIPIQVGK